MIVRSATEQPAVLRSGRSSGTPWSKWVEVYQMWAVAKWKLLGVAIYDGEVEKELLGCSVRIEMNKELAAAKAARIETANELAAAKAARCEAVKELAAAKAEVREGE